MGTDIESTLSALFKGSENPAAVITKTVPPSGMGAPSPGSRPPQLPVTNAVIAPPGLQAAATHYSRAIAALKQGDWTSFGAEMRQLGEELGQPADSTRH
jgi:uncharacterized membrane protein (UPF0182 family)